MKKKMKRFISRNPDVMGGAAVIAGTRIPIARILFLLEDGYTPEAIHDEYPHVSTTVIKKTMRELANIADEYAPQIS